MTRRGEQAGVEGFLLVDKPTGVSSFAVVAEVRRRTRTRQVGHAGTLDPLASGLLPVLVGEATKLVPHMMGLDKEYVARVRLGVATDTYDAEGRVTARGERQRIALLTEVEVDGALRGFVGRVLQRPPAYSAIKRDGVRMYERARAAVAEGGQAADVEVEEREVEIRSIETLAFRPLGGAGAQSPVAETMVEAAEDDAALPEVELRIRCGKGTYVRSIAHDLGERLGVHAHLVALRRTRIGDFEVRDAVDVFAEPRGPLSLAPRERAVAHLPSLTIDAEVERRLRLGQQAPLAELVCPLDARAVRLLDADGTLVAIAEAALGQLSLTRVFARPGKTPTQ